MWIEDWRFQRTFFNAALHWRLQMFKQLSSIQLCIEDWRLCAHQYIIFWNSPIFNLQSRARSKKVFWKSSIFNLQSRAGSQKVFPQTVSTLWGSYGSSILWGVFCRPRLSTAQARAECRLWRQCAVGHRLRDFGSFCRVSVHVLKQRGLSPSGPGFASSVSRFPAIVLCSL